MMRHLLRALTLVAALVVGSQAQATTLAVCTEDINCVFQGSISLDGTSGHFNSAYSRFGLTFANNNGDTLYPPSNRIETTPFSASTFWVTGTYLAQNFGNALNFLTLESAGGTPRIIFQISAAGSQNFNILKRTAAGANTTLVSSCGPLSATFNLGKLDVYINDSVTGTITVYNNGTQICSFSGDTTTDGVSTLTTAAFGTMSQNGTLAPMTWSEMLVSDQDTRSRHPMSCAPAAAGNTQAWTGSVSNVNPVNYNDANFNYDGTASQLSQWTMNCPSAIQPSWGIVDVQQFARVAVGSSGPQHFRFSAHVGGADYDNGADIAGALSFQNYLYDWGANSPSGGAWTPGELTSGFSSGIESTP